MFLGGIECNLECFPLVVSLGEGAVELHVEVLTL